MATKFRRDLTAEDFRLIRLFKTNLLTLIKIGKIPQPKTILRVCYHQEWYKSVGGWKPNLLIKRLNAPCYGLTLEEFRKVIRGISKVIPNVSEGLIVNTFTRASIFLLDEDGGWKWDRGSHKPLVFLEYCRLSPEGMLTPRNPNTARARLDSIHQVVEQVAYDNDEEDEDVAFQMASAKGLLGGITTDQVAKLEQRSDVVQAEKKQRRREIDQRIKRRLKKRR